MGKDPSVLLYTSDFLTGTMTMTDEQVGKYIRLLCLQHQKGRLSERDMLSVCREFDADVYDKFVKDDTGKYYNQRMETETTKRKAFSDSRRKNIMKRYEQDEKEEEKDYKCTTLEPTYVATSVLHMENENEIVNRGGVGENKNKRKPREQQPKTKYGKLDNVLLTDSEYEKLRDSFGEHGRSDRIENLSLYIASKGVKYDSHYATILSWERKNNRKQGPETKGGGNWLDEQPIIGAKPKG